MHIVKEIIKAIHPKEKGLIVVSSNHLKFIRRSIGVFDKTLQGAVEGASLIIEIKQLIKSVKKKYQ